MKFSGATKDVCYRTAGVENRAPVSPLAGHASPQAPPLPPLPFSPGDPPLTPASAASDQLWLPRRISSKDQGRSHTGSDAGARSCSGIAWFICNEKDEKRG